MKNIILVFIITAIILPTISYSNNLDIQDLSKNFIDLLAKERFKEVDTFFTEEVAKALPEHTLESVWKSLVVTLGRFNKILETKITEYGEYKIVVAICDFELATMGIQMTFNKESKMAGLYFLQPQFKATYTQPPYVDSSKFIEIEVMIGKEEWRLPATLTIPKTGMPCPAVVLVHGSGPQDRDETIGPNKPFKDLAWGLASMGIAVLRYEKRTRYYGEKSLIDGFSVNEEVIEDAINGIEFLSQREEIDKSKIYLLGHSLGGMIAPRIALHTKYLKGIIILAGAVRDLLDLILRQTRYLASLDGNIDENEEKEIKAIENETERIRSLKIGKDEVILGAPGSYWLDLINYNPIESIRTIDLPVLILQGDRDYQVTVKDFELWKEELKDKTNITFKLYRGLNHLFIYGEGISTPEEYYKPGNVAQEVIEDIVRWIKSSQI